MLCNTIISITKELMNQNLIENKKTWQGLDSFQLVKLSNAGNVLNYSVNIIPPVETSTTEVLQELHPEAVENASPDPTFTNTEAAILKSTENEQNANVLQETPVLKSSQHQENVNFSHESSETPLKAVFLALKCFIKDELNDIRETIEKVSQKFDQIFYREYTKNLWDEIASKNTIISLLTENINNLSRSHSQSETCYQPQKHNKAQNTQTLLDDQPFTVPRKRSKRKRIA